MNKLSRLLVLAIAASTFLFAFSQGGIAGTFSEKENTFPMLEPGDKIDDMTIITGTKYAVPLWTACSPKKVNDNLISGECSELPVYSKLAIGHTLGVMDLLDPSIEWEELIWELSLDGHPIDLEAFGVYDFVYPDFPSKPLGEVFRVVRVWDVVLVNPTPGMHRIHGQVQDGVAKYTWVVNFTVAMPLRLVKGGQS